MICRTLLCLAPFAFNACFNDTPREKSLIDRTVNALRIEAVDSNFKVVWQAPSDPEFLKGYHLWIAQDTSLNSMIQRSDVLSSDYTNTPDRLYYSGIFNPNSDSLFWRLPDSLLKQMRQRNLDSATVMVWAEYTQSTPGARLHTPLFLSDIFPAELSQSQITPSPSGAEITFLPPKDQISSWDQKHQGPIWGYVLKISGPKAGQAQLSSADTTLQILADKSIPLQRFAAGLDTSKIGTSPALDTLRSWVILQKSSHIRDSALRLSLSNLDNLQLYQYQLRSLDSKGNFANASGGSSEELQIFRTVSKIPPTFGSTQLNLKINSPGNATLSWTSATIAISVPSPWSDISFYRIKIKDMTQSDSARILYSPSNSSTLRGLFPGHRYQIQVQARDSSGNYSQALNLDTTLVSNTSCPEGMSPVQGSQGIFCMGQYEFKDQGQFVTRIRAEKAAELCKAQSKDGFQVDLCTSTQWTSACKNTDLTGIADFGFSRFGDSTAYTEFLYGACNFGTGKPNSPRNPLCVTSEGIYDLPGQLQEWTYKDSAGITKDTSFVLKGGSWIANFPNESYASCASSSVGVWSRPKAWIYTRDTVVLLKSGVQTLKTSQIKSSDISRTLEAKDFKDLLIHFKVYDGSTEIGADTLRLSDVTNTNTMNALTNGYNYVAQDTLKSIIQSTITKNANRMYRSQAVGLRCCASPKP